MNNCRQCSDQCRRSGDNASDQFVFDVEKATLQNTNFRTAIWTGTYLQVTLMSIKPGEEIGLEIHPELDQFLKIEQGQGIVMMGSCKDRMNFRRRVEKNCAILIPAGTWHNLVNTGHDPIKLYSIYAPPQHPHCTVHVTKEDADKSHH